MIRVLRVVLDDQLWPLITVDVNGQTRTSLYDTAISNLEMPVLNGFRATLREMIALRKENPNADENRNAQVQTRNAEVGKREESQVAKAGSRHRTQRTAKIKTKAKVK